MAERTWLEEDFSNPYGETDPYKDGVSAKDYPLAFGSRAAGMVGDLGAAVRAIGESREDENYKAGQAAEYLGKFTQSVFGGLEDAAIENMSPTSKRDFQSAVTSPEFWSLNSFALKSLNMAPDIAAAAIPSAIFPGIVAATSIAAMQGGVTSTAGVIDEMYRMTDALSDAELQKQAPLYARIRGEGKNEEQARREYNEVFRGMRPLIAGAIGTVTNAFGPAGQAARAMGGGAAALSGEVGEKLLTRVGKGVAEGAISEGIQEGSEDLVTQQGAVEATLASQINIGQTLESAATGAVMGGILGGGVSAVAGRGHRESGVDTTPAEMPLPAGNNAPNTPGAAVPSEMASMPSASGQTATPGVSDVTATSTTAQELQARKNFGMEYSSLTPEQQATIDGKLQSRGMPVNVVDGASPDAAQADALAQQQNTKVPEQLPPVEVPQVEVPAPVEVAPVQDTVQPAEATPAPALPEAAPIQQPVEQVQNIPEVAPPVEQPTGPRILQDMTQPDYAAENAARISQNIRDMDAPQDAVVKGRNRTIAEQNERTAVRDGSKMLADKYPPREEEAGLLSKKANEVVAARKIMLDRAQTISQEADAMGLKLPKAFRDNAKQQDGFNPETLLVMEAKRLANAKSPSLADFKRFMSRELDVRTGSMDQAVSERRAEGDAANRQVADIDAADLVDGDAPLDTMDPEARLIAAEEEQAEAGISKGDRVSARNRQVQEQAPMPSRIEKALDEALYTTPSASRKAPVVETRKVRKITKPTEAAKPAPSDAVRTKKDELLARVRESRAAKEDVTPKVTRETNPFAAHPVVFKIQERVNAAREKTNTNPTPAQAIAGNYKKGKVSIHGNPIAIENPKGSMRTNKDPNGPKWKVKLPADYGYLEGTKGADGDPIDVYVGPDHDASYVYVVDQIDPDSRVFDEHKVMMGFKNEQAAISAYDRAYSDGRGAERIGGLRKMTQDEFKAWKNSDPKDRSDVPTELMNEARSLMFEDELLDAIEGRSFLEASAPEGMVRDPITREVARPVSTRKASEVMRDLDVRTLNGAPRLVAGVARNMLTKAVGDVNIHFVTKEDIARLSGRNDVNILGYHVFKDSAEEIFVQADLMNDPARLRHVVLHEVTHAATVKAIVSDRALSNNISRLMDYIAVDLRKMDRADMNTVEYGWTNTREFIAEAFSNPEFQEVLQRIPAPEAVSKFLKLDATSTSIWDMLIQTIRKALRLPENTTNMLEAAIRVTEMSMKPRMLEVTSGKSFLEDGNMSPLVDSLRDSLKALNTRPELAPTKGNPALLGFRTFDNIARSADRYFKGNNPVRKIANLIEGQRVKAIAEFDRAAPIIQKLHDLQTKYRGQVWTDFASLVHDETMSGVYADRPLSSQAHISKEGSKDSWQRQQYPELAKRYDALPDDLKAARLEAMDFFRAKQNEIALKLIRNRIVTLFDTTDPEGLAQRIHDGSVTDADKALMGEAYDAIAAAGVLSKINGPYVPLMRRGNFVVKGRYKVAEPQNATKIADNEYEFEDRAAASKFAASQSGRPTLRTIYVDKNTGSRTGTENGSTVRLTAQDIDAVPRYRVVVQDRHMEMFDTMTEARARVAELRAMGIQADDAVPRQFDNFGIQADALSTQMRRLSTVLDRRADARQFTPEQKMELLGTLNEVSLSMLGSTRIQSRSLPRQYVAGASKDFVRNTTDYAHSAGNYVAKLDYRPQIDAALGELADAVKENASDGFASGRVAIQNEVTRRITTPNPATENSKFNSLSSRILTMSFIDKLMSPSYSVINATQPMMITAPYLASHYGAGRAYAAMARAYNDIGSMKALKEGFAATAQRTVPGSTIVPSDPVSLIRSRLTNKSEQALIDVLVERGVIDTDSGLEVGKMVRESKGIVGKLDKGVGYLEGIARQMPKTIEAMNRTVSALAAYRLEMERSGNDARAVQFAQDAINLTQFNYSASNSSPFMNHPMLRLVLQFKKYGISMYQFLGEQAAIAIRNEAPGDRAQAVKALSYTIGMHVLMAGAMGLPTEPIKLMVMAANGLGLVGWSWEDVEEAQREALADLLGKQVGEIASRGIPRAFGIDLSSRMGIDTLMGPFGEPRSNEAQDWKAYMWDFVSGAPAGLVTDWAKGVNDLAQGEVVRAAERLIPIKALSDSIKAYRTATEGTVSERSGKQVMSPYSATEAAFRALGFQPSREAESYERSGSFYRGRDQQKEVRGEFQREWVEANSAARGRIWRDIQKWNKSQPRDARISLDELRGYQRRMETDKKNTQEGIRARKREQHLLERTNSTYNFE